MHKVAVVIYSIVTLHYHAWERERGFLEKLEVEGKMTREKGKNRKKVMSVVVVVCGFWFTFQLFRFFLSLTLWCKFRQTWVGLEMGTWKVDSPFCCYYIPSILHIIICYPPPHSLSLATSLDPRYLIMKSKWMARVKDHGQKLLSNEVRGG